MPRTPADNEQLRADSVRRLLEAARLTFVRLGYERATVRDIAQQAGVAHGLLYNYFSSKDDLLRAVFAEGAREVAEALGGATEGGTPAARLERVIRGSFEILRKRREFWHLSYMLRHQPRTADVLGGELHAWIGGVRAQLEALLRALGHADAPALSRVLFAAIDGVAQHYVLDPDDYPLDETVDCLVDQFCRAGACVDARGSGTLAPALRPTKEKSRRTSTRRGKPRDSAR